MNQAEKELFDQIYELHTEINCLSEREHFIYGFRIGSQIAWEVMNYISPNFTQ